MLGTNSHANGVWYLDAVVIDSLERTSKIWYGKPLVEQAFYIFLHRALRRQLHLVEPPQVPIVVALKRGNARGAKGAGHRL